MLPVGLSPSTCSNTHSHLHQLIGAVPSGLSNVSHPFYIVVWHPCCVHGSVRSDVSHIGYTAHTHNIPPFVPPTTIHSMAYKMIGKYYYSASPSPTFSHQQPSHHHRQTKNIVIRIFNYYCVLSVAKRYLPDIYIACEFFSCVCVWVCSMCTRYPLWYFHCFHNLPSSI